MYDIKIMFWFELKSWTLIVEKTKTKMLLLCKKFDDPNGNELI
jgi:hypothetical protein